MSIDSTSWAPVEDFLQESDRETTDCFNRTQWNELCRIASDLNGHLKCTALNQVANGLNNIVRLLEFSDGTRWAARVHIQRNTSIPISTKLGSEVATMQFIKEHSSIPVPRVFAYEFELEDKNTVGNAFILMEVLPGSVAMDTLGGHKAHRGVIPKQHRQRFYRSVARCHVCPLNLSDELSSCLAAYLLRSTVGSVGFFTISKNRGDHPYPQRRIRVWPFARTRWPI